MDLPTGIGVRKKRSIHWFILKLFLKGRQGVRQAQAWKLMQWESVAGYLQDLVYKLSKVGQAIENNDLSTAGSVLGGSTNTDWVQKANIAFSKVNMVNIVLSFKLLSTCDCFCVICPQLSSSTEEKKQVDTFNSSLSSLISSGGLFLKFTGLYCHPFHIFI